MKKTISMALAFALAGTLSTAAFADAVIDQNGGTKDIDVNAKYVDGRTSATVINADVKWGKMEFTYTVTGTKNWNADKQDYDVDDTGVWVADGNEISVTNHSNTDINADFEYLQLEGYKSVSGEFSDKRLSLPSAEGKAVGAAELTKKSTLSLYGELPEDATAMTNVGTVVVTIAEANT